jgi:hypothetical protein
MGKFVDANPHTDRNSNAHAVSHRKRHPDSYPNPDTVSHRNAHLDARVLSNANPHRDPHLDSHRNPHPDAHPNPHTVWHRNAHPDARALSHANPHRDPHPDPHAVAYRNPHPDSHRDPHPDSHRDPYPDSHRDPYPDSHRNPHAVAHRNPHPLSYPNPHTGSYRNANAVSHANPDTDSYPSGPAIRESARRPVIEGTLDDRSEIEHREEWRSQADEPSRPARRRRACERDHHSEVEDAAPMAEAARHRSGGTKHNDGVNRVLGKRQRDQNRDVNGNRPGPCLARERRENEDNIGDGVKPASELVEGSGPARDAPVGEVRRRTRKRDRTQQRGPPIAGRVRGDP